MSPRSPRKLIVLFVLFFVAISCGGDVDIIEEIEPITEVPYRYTLLEQKVTLLINTHREQLGLNPLKMLNEASLQSQNQSQHMTEYKHMCHCNFADRYNYLVATVNATRVGENTAFGFETANSVVDNWLKSYTHKNIIEDPLFTHFGISIKKGEDNNNYFCQIFAKLPE